jgi:hypothetical protein
VAHVAGTEAAEVASMTARRQTQAPIGPESQLVPGDWRYTKTTLLPIRAAFCRAYLMMHSGDGRLS